MRKKSKNTITYRDAGVDIDLGNRLVSQIREAVKSTYRPEVISDIGSFNSLFSLNLEKYRNPVLVSSTDGVGTKLKIAFLMDKHDTVGIDLVAMCVNDIIVSGAEPLFLLDYLATSQLVSIKVGEIIQGIVQGCTEAGCALIGGETAEMPSFYNRGEYDLAGFVVGVVDREKVIDGSSITMDNKIIGIASSGLHSNGYSLARKIVFDHLKLSVHDKPLGGKKSIGELLLEPTKIYVRKIQNLLRDFHINGIAHITGGGFIDNLPRILPQTCRATIYKGSWEIPPLFPFLQESGNISEREMFRTFNQGIGMMVVVPSDEADDIVSRLKGHQEDAFIIGEINLKDKDNEEIVFL
jgi:phosphoribosylformylglycinamidine cyclo-ligase